MTSTREAPSLFRPIARAKVWLLVPALLAAACGGERDVPPTVGAGPKTVTVTYPVDFEGVNEVVAQATPIHTALHYFALFLPLAEEQPDYDEGQPTFLPRLAERWEIDREQLEITFFLRDDVSWSDGEPVTAEDVRFTWQAQTHPDVLWSNAGSKANIEEVEILDPHTVRFHFRELTPTLLFEACQGVILPQHAWSQLPFSEWRQRSDWFEENLVTNGPFLLESRSPGQRFVLAANPDYYEPGLPKVDRVVFEVVPDAMNQLALLRSGRAHFMELVPYAEAAAVEADPALYLTSYTARNFYFVGWNTARPPFDSETVRRAITLGIDRQVIIDSLFYGYGEVSVSPIPSGLWGFDDELEPLPYDPDEASRLLAEAGFSDGDGDGVLEREGQPFRFEMLTNSDNALRQDIIVMIQGQLGRIGVDVVPRTMDFNAMIGPLQAHDFDAVVMGLAISTDLDLSYNFHTRAIEGGFNWGRFSDPETDRLIDSYADIGLGPEERRQLLIQIQRRLAEMQPVTHLYESIRLSGARRELQEIDPNPVSTFFHLRRWELVEEPAGG